MNEKDALSSNANYSITAEGAHRLQLVWRHVQALSAEAFAHGILDLARKCSERGTAQVLIDACLLDPSSPAVSWLRDGGELLDGQEYGDWWLATVVPLYHGARLTHLAVGTGDPNAPGQLPERQGVRFRIGYFENTAHAEQWLPE